MGKNKKDKKKKKYKKLLDRVRKAKENTSRWE